jgi:MFS family permease
MPPATDAAKPGLRSIVEGLDYARRRPELIGTYVVDIVAMTFAMPTALFPALAQTWGGPAAAGWLYAAMPFGSFVTMIFSGWSKKVSRRGAAVVLAAAAWGVAVVALGHAGSLATALVCLALAGAADAVSGLFRMTIWNETIPAHLRGRLAGVEMISYMTGPLLGNARAGWMASLRSTRFSIVGGGWICLAGVLLCIPLLPKFWRYRPSDSAVLPGPPMDAAAAE